jgi:hypothetical protein
MIKPLQVPWLPFMMRAMDFQSNHTPFQQEQFGTDTFYVTSATDIPAFVEEPNMPPEDDIRPWVLL